jgi:hypothetical protein
MHRNVRMKMPRSQQCLALRVGDASGNGGCVFQKWLAFFGVTWLWCSARATRLNLKCLSLFFCSPREHDVLPVPRPHEYPHLYTRSSQARITCQLEIISPARICTYQKFVFRTQHTQTCGYSTASTRPTATSSDTTTTTMAPTSFASAAAGSNANPQRAETSADWCVLLFLIFCTLHAHIHHPSFEALEYRFKLCDYTPYFSSIRYNTRFQHDQKYALCAEYLPDT